MIKTQLYKLAEYLDKFLDLIIKRFKQLEHQEEISELIVADFKTASAYWHNNYPRWDVTLATPFKKWARRWLMSTNHKDIGTLYVIFGAFSGIMGTFFSIVIRIELSSPDFSVLHFNNNLYNAIITGHAFLMIFFFYYAYDDRRFW